MDGSGIIASVAHETLIPIEARLSLDHSASNATALASHQYLHEDWPLNIESSKAWQVSQSFIFTEKFQAIFFVPLILVGVVGNALVCIAIYFERSLHNVTNYFLFSLAIADWLVSAVVMPTAMVHELRNGIWLAATTV